MFGRNPYIPQDLLQDNPSLSASEAITNDDQWAASQAVRVAARKAVLECQDDKALRAALRARSRVHREVSSGDWAYYWRSQKWQNGVLVKGGRWYGAAMVLGHIGRNVVVSHRRSIFRVAPEHIRLATSEEREVAEFPEAELLGIKTLLQKGQFPKSQFQDLVGQEAPPEPEAQIRPIAMMASRPAAHTAAELFRASQDSEPPEAVPLISPEEGVVRDDLKVAVPYGPARYRRHHKSAPFEPSSQLHRLPDSRIEDFSDMMNEVVPRLMEGLMEGSDNSNEESNGPDVTLSSPRMAGHKREASKEAVSQPSVSRPRLEDPDEELLCQIDVAHDDQKSIVECLMANFIQKKLQKELPPTGNPTELQDKIDKAKKTEWETLSGKNAVRILTGVRAKHAKEKQSHRFIGSRYVITERKKKKMFVLKPGGASKDILIRTFQKR